MKTLEELQNQEYRKDNYIIEYSDNNQDCVAIYFTSNNLFYPHDKDTFQESVIKKNRYEWTKINIKRANKHIFVRDIYKQWYASGINDRFNNIDSLTEWLTIETKGYKEIITVGSSGGGYAASIIGTKLHATLIFNFNGQWNINDNIERNGRIISPILKKIKDNKREELKYFNIARDEFDSSRIFYFVSIHSKWDAEQLMCINNFKNVHRICFLNAHHGIPFLKNVLPTIINMTFDELCKLEKKKHTPLLFEIKYAGLISTCSTIIKQLIKRRR